MSPIEAPVLDRLSDVGHMQRVGSGEISDGPGNLEHPVIRPRGQAQPGDCRSQDPFRLGSEGAVAAHLTRRHVGIGVHPGNPGEARPLGGTGTLHPFRNRLARLGRLRSREVAIGNGRHLQVDVDAIEQWPRHPGAIALDRVRRAEAGMRGISRIATGAPLQTH